MSLLILKFELFACSLALDSAKTLAAVMLSED
jgi:hypothetical protein